MRCLREWDGIVDSSSSFRLLPYPEAPPFPQYSSFALRAPLCAFLKCLLSPPWSPFLAAFHGPRSASTWPPYSFAGSCVFYGQFFWRDAVLGRLFLTAREGPHVPLVDLLRLRSVLHAIYVIFCRRYSARDLFPLMQSIAFCIAAAPFPRLSRAGVRPEIETSVEAVYFSWSRPRSLVDILFPPNVGERPEIPLGFPRGRMRLAPPFFPRLFRSGPAPCAYLPDSDRVSSNLRRPFFLCTHVICPAEYRPLVISFDFPLPGRQV